MARAASFIKLLRRAVHSGFPRLLMHGRMLMQCFNVDDDGEVGMNYVLHVPDTDDYDDPFYDEDVIFNVRDVMNTYTKGHRDIDGIRKELGEKSKAVSEEVRLDEDGRFIFTFILNGERDTIISIESVDVTYPIDPASGMVRNVEQSYNNLIGRIRLGGACLTYDGLRFGLQRYAMECSEVYTFIVKFHGRKLSVPLTKSMFGGIRELDSFTLSVQEANIDGLYVYALSLMKAGIAETYWGYIIQY